MNIYWGIIFKSAWSVFWITTLYSYVSCGIIGTITAFKTKNDKTKIDAAVDQFIISPFYIATFFCLLCVLLFSCAYQIKDLIQGNFYIYTLAIGGVVFLGHLLVEILEATIVRKNPLRILQDKEALYLSAIYLIVTALTVCVVSITF